MFALALIVATHSNIVLAQTTCQEAVYQDNGLDLDEVSINLTWLLLSGESVESLATLFYPKNKKMQRLFISKTLQLSHEINPNLNAFFISNQESLIIIPDIKSLAKYSGKIESASSKKLSKPNPAEQRLSDQLKDAAKFAPSPEMQAHYEDLVKRNALFQSDLEKLNIKLAQLEQVMAALNVEARRTEVSPKFIPSSEPEHVVSSENKLKQVRAVKNNVASLRTVTTRQSPMTSQYLMGLISLLLLILGTFLTFIFYKSRKAKKLSLVRIGFSGTTYPEETSLNKASFSPTANEYTGSISDKNLDVAMSLSTKEDAQSLLEEAKVYVEIGREDEAIMLLKSQIQSAPLASLEHYLYLLDIYRATNQEEEFLLYASKFHKSFNVMTPLWKNTPLAMAIASSLEEFPHIVNALTILWWASSEAVTGEESKIKAYLNALLMDNRNGERVGFSMEVVQEIMLLCNLLEVRDILQDDA